MNRPLITSARTDPELINLWLGRKSPTTQVSYGAIIRQFLEFIDKALVNVTLDDLELWLRRLRLTYKPATVQNKILVVKSLFSFCVEVGYLEVNVGFLLKSPKLKDTLSRRILAVEEVKKIINATTNQRDLCLFSLIYGCGLRVSEALGITWADLHRGKVTVLGKGNKTRVVLVPEGIWQMLMELPRLGEYVFSARGDRPLDRTYIHRKMKKLAEKAEVNPLASTHWLRHSHASHAIEAGCNLRLLQQSLGHSKLETTEKYLHVNPNDGSSRFIDI
jgi:integrase/recombinase XerD